MPISFNSRILDLLKQERGAALLLTFLLMLVLSGFALGAGVFSHNSMVAGKSYMEDKEALYIAEAGLERARQQIEAGNWSAATSPGNEYNESFGAGEYVVTIVDNGSDLYTITSEAYIPNDTNPVAQRQIVETDLEVGTGTGNIAPTATAAASSTQGGSSAANANDASMSTSWTASTQGSGEWLSLDFSSATALDQVVIYEKNNITGITVEYSSDGSSWNTVPSLTGDGDNSDTTWTFTFTSTSDRYFRAVFTASGVNKKVSVYEFEASNDPGGNPTISQDGAVTTTW